MTDKITRLKELLKETNGIISEQKEMSFSTIHKFGFDISKETDLDRYIFEFNSIEEFTIIVSTSCESINKEYAKNVVEKILTENGKSLNDKFYLTFITT